MAARLFAAQNPGDVFGIVVRHCGVETHTHRTCPSCNGQCLGAGGVGLVLPSGVDIQICGVHFHAGYIHLGNIFCLQEHCAYYHAHCHSTTGEGGHIGPAIGVESTVDVHIAGVYMDAVKPGKHMGRVEHQQHLGRDPHCAAIDIGSVAFRTGAHVVPDSDAARIHRTRSHIGSGIRSCTDVGVHSGGCFGQSNCRTHSHSTAGHAQSKCLRIAVYNCIERNVRGTGRTADGYALGQEGLNQMLVDGHSHACIPRAHAGSNTCCRTGGSVVHLGLHPDMGHILHRTCTFHGCLGAAVKDGGSCAGANARHTAAQTQRCSHNVPVVTDGPEGQLTCLSHAAQQPSADVAAQVNHCQSYAHTSRARYAAAYRESVDGQVGKVELVALSVQVIHAVPVTLGEVCSGQQRALGNGFDGDVSACPEQGILPRPGFNGTIHNGHCHAHACAHSAGGSESHRAETCV